MTNDIDQYLSSLLSFTPCRKRNNRFSGDYVSLIHVPANGPEQVYSVVFNDDSNVLTLARYCETVWELLEDCELVGSDDRSPEVDVLQTKVKPDHPVFNFLNRSLLQECQDHSDGERGMDYYMLMWQKDGQGSVAECWEPYGRNDFNWMALVGSMELLASQFEYAATAS
ncbi:MAG: hypothetical protein HN457_09635 [Opitutales bacterium]|jgi:hypothetical protein|nr:hypothetical protein [Opitutales bacterium]MBT5813589.1 hypothetical protein [Opitutales bacterium]MBT6381050.1 hypothetical protein [Opitutales bacterium]MBT6768164.1 hypothetical protein [Opitutales bacterium]MBT7865840.1 hypothetical protein [Opitutales bacterium]